MGLPGVAETPTVSWSRAARCSAGGQELKGEEEEEEETPCLGSGPWGASPDLTAC